MTQILVVDDEELFRETLCDSLIGAGYTCEQATNGKEALTILLARSVDIVLTDNLMPHMNGLELVWAMKTQEALKQTPAILFTGNPEPNLLKVAQHIGVFKTLVKPFNFDDLVGIIHEALTWSARRTSEGE